MCLIQTIRKIALDKELSLSENQLARKSENLTCTTLKAPFLIFGIFSSVGWKEKEKKRKEEKERGGRREKEREEEEREKRMNKK